MTGGLDWLLAAVTVHWLIWLARNLRDLRRTPTLTLGDPPAGEDGPVVSLLVPARNEASRQLAASLRSMLTQDYPHLEVLVVDDRSTDATPAILADLAAEFPRLTVIRGEEPPAGWLGKPHALQQAWRRARGEWCLATDADMFFAPGLVGRAVRRALDLKVDALTLIPRDLAPALGPRLVMPVAIWMIFVAYPPASTNSPRGRRALASGGFFLLRRSALEWVDGWAAVAGEVADDVGLAMALKATGARLHCASGATLLGTPMYRSLAELRRGFGKNILWGLRGNRLLGLICLLGLVGGCLLPPALALTGQPLAVAATLAQIAAFVPYYRRYGLPGPAALAVPWAFAQMAAVLTGALVRSLLGRPIDWRGRPVPPARARGRG